MPTRNKKVMVNQVELSGRDTLDGVDSIDLVSLNLPQVLSDDIQIGRQTWKDLKRSAMKPDYKSRYWFVSILII